MAGGDILIRWASDSTQAVRDMARVEKALGNTMRASDKTARRWQTAGDVMQKAGIAMSGAIVAEAVRAGKAAAIQEQAVGGLTAVFKEQAPQMEKWAKSMSDFGLSMTETSQAAAVLGSSLKSSGFSLRDTADWTKQLTELAADLAATFGGKTQDALEALTASLRGEFDPLERFGSQLSASRIEAEMGTEAFKKLGIENEAYGKKLATLRLIMRDTKDAQGQSRREFETSAAAYERFMAKWKNAEADLGAALLPVMEELGNRLADIADAAERDPENVRKWAKALVALAGSLLILGTAAKSVTVIQGLGAAFKKFPAAGRLFGVAGAIAAVAVGIVKLRDSRFGPEGVADFWNNKVFTVGFWQNIGSAVAGFGDKVGDAIANFGPVKWIALQLARLTDFLRITSGEYERTRRTFDNPIQIKAANKQALAAAGQVQKVLDTIGRSKPQATIRAANRDALAAARTAQNALDDVKQRQAALIRADASLAKAEVIAWKAWAEAQQALITVRTRIVGPAGNSSDGPTRGYGLRSTWRGTSSAPSVVINVNGYNRDPVVLAREIRKTLRDDDIRTNRVGLAR